MQTGARRRQRSRPSPSATAVLAAATGRSRRRPTASTHDQRDSPRSPLRLKGRHRCARQPVRVRVPTMVCNRSCDQCCRAAKAATDAVNITHAALDPPERGFSGRPSATLRKVKRSRVNPFNGHAAHVVGYEPCFEVADIQRATGHYRLLGFTISYHDANYAFAHRDKLTIHLAHSEQPTTGPGVLYLHVDDADRLADQWREAGVDVVGPDDTTTASVKAPTWTPTGTCSGSGRRSAAASEPRVRCGAPRSSRAVRATTRHPRSSKLH